MLPLLKNIHKHIFWWFAFPFVARFIESFWLGLTILFEFGFGHYVMSNSWQKLLHYYNLAEGKFGL